jgi:hypothetical protein
MLSAPRAQKLSLQINVELVGSQEVCGWYADGITSQPHPGYPTLCDREHRQSGQIEATAPAESVAYSRKYTARMGGFLPPFSNCTKSLSDSFG